MTPLGRFRTLVLVVLLTGQNIFFFSYSSTFAIFLFFFYSLLQLSDLLLFFPLIFNLYLLFHPFVPFPIFSFSFIITPLFPFLFCSVFCRQFLLFSCFFITSPSFVKCISFFILFHSSMYVCNLVHLAIMCVLFICCWFSV